MELFLPPPIEQPVHPHAKEFAMQAQLHTMSNLFSQLGLPADEAAVENFIATHRPLETAQRFTGHRSGVPRKEHFSRKKSSKTPTGPPSSTNLTGA